MENQFNQLMLYYTQIRNMAQELKVMLENEAYNEAMTMLNNRERVVKELKLMLNYVTLTPAQKKIVNEIKEEIKVLETENMQKLEKDMEDVRYELEVVSSKVKFRHKYNPYELESKSGNVIDTKDNEAYRDIAFNDQLKARVNEAIANPSVMKSAAWRSGLFGDLNSVDYSALSKLKASAEAAKVYDAAVKKLAMEGKMPPGWEPDYFNTYSTVDSG